MLHAAAGALARAQLMAREEPMDGLLVSRGLSFVLTDPPTGRYREPICCSGWYFFKPRAPGEPSTHSPRAAAEWECAALVRVTAM